MVHNHLINLDLARTAGKLSGARRVAMMLLLMMLTMTAQTAWAGSGVKYVTADGTEMNTADDGIDGNDNPTVLTGNETEISGGWYVVAGNITYTSPLVFTGDVTLILTDGHTMSFGTSENPIIGDKEGVFVTYENSGWMNSLTIYGQSLDKNVAGNLIVYAGQGNNYQPKGIVAENYTQHSGNVTTNAVYSAIYAYDDITINGGVVNATSTLATGESTFRLGWSAMVAQNNFFIVTGGQLTANSISGDGVWGDNIHISGGTINSTGGCHGLGADHNINISGGKIDATTTHIIKNYGIASGDNIYLGYSSSDDYIQATGYMDGGAGDDLYITANRKIKVGETELDGGESGRPLSSTEISSLANQKLTPVTHTVTFSLTGSGPEVPAQTVAYGTPITVPTAAGYKLMNWKKGGESYDITTPVTEDITLTAEWVQLGDLKITNTVESDLAADAAAEFTFTVTLGDNTISGTYGDMAFTSGVATVTLKDGEYATATGLLYGTTYNVTQTEKTGFDTTYGSESTSGLSVLGTLNSAEETAVFLNTRKTGDLNISAVLVSDRVADADAEFTFTVTLVDNPISGNYGDMTFAEGVATVTLKGRESATATGLPTTVGYTVTQTPQTGFNVTGKTGDTGTISTTASTAAFTNTREIGDLTVSNTVYIDNDEEFEYTVTLSDDVSSKTYGGMTFNGCVAIFSLKHGGSVTATGLPTGVDYTVTQTAKDGFTTTQTGNTGTITTTPATAAFKNIKLMPASVSIDWKDGNNGSGRPEALTVNLLSKLKGSESDPLPVTGQQNKTLNAGNNWTVTIDHLPMYNEAGTEIEYSWSAITAPNGYLLDVDVSDTGADVTYTFTKATTATLAVTWDDNNNQDGIRPSGLVVTLHGDGDHGPYMIASNTWTFTVENDLPMYDGSNNLINYTWTVTDPELPEGYSLTGSSKDGTTTTLTLSYTPETTSSTVIVNWDDESNQDNIRPTALTVSLLAKVGTNDAVALDPQPTISWTKYESHWTATVANLPKNENGTEIAYTWTVTTANLPEGYTLAYTYTSTSEGTTSLDLMHNTSKTSATLQITWYDANNGGSRLPVNAALYVGENPVEGKTVTLRSDNEWTATISDLPANDNGVAIVYTWKVEEGPETELTNAGYTLYDTSTSGTVTTLIYRNAAAQSAFTFAESNVTKTIDYGSFTIEPIGAQENPTITYSSSNVSVAEVDETTGEVTIKGSGVTTITATAAETNNYLSATAKYTLTVTGGSTGSPVSIQLTEDYGTFCWDADLDFSGIDGLNAYIAAGFDASTGVLTMVKVTSVPAGTGLLLRGSAGYNYTATVQSSTWVYANLLRGTTTETSLTAGGNDFILGKKNGTIGFYPVSENGKIAANKAYLHLDNIPNISSARSFVSISFVDDATALDAVRWNKETGRGDAWYSLDGRKLQGKPTVKGLYIHNGKKEAVK